MALTSKLTAIADAIRGKTGGTDLLTMDQMVTEIEGIETGSSLSLNLLEWEKLAVDEVEELENDSITDLRTYAFYAKSIKKVTLSACTILETRCFSQMESLTYLDLPVAKTFYATCLQRCTVLETLIIRTGSVATMRNTTALSTCTLIATDGTGYIYVPSDLVESYQSATNWSTYADQIRAIEDYPDICGETE